MTRLSALFATARLGTALVPALFLASCTPAAAPGPTSDPTPDLAANPAPTPSAAYLALGTEPGWTLEITPATLRYNGDYGDTRLTLPTPAARTIPGGRRYEDPRLTVEITPGPCSDGMSDRRYADTVVLTTGGQRLRGCGGAILAPDTLDGTSWRIVAVNGVATRRLADGSSPALRFERDRVTGTTGCNRLTADYRVTGDRLTLGPLATTRRACTDEGGMLENGMLATLSGPVTIRALPDGRMTLTGEDGFALTLERLI